MHLFEPSVGFYGTSGIVGPSILLATGAGYKAKLEGSQRVGVAFFGDGASNNGAFHEGINMASAWSLPVVYVCENNLYATEVPLCTISKSPSVAERAAGLGLPGVQVDGQDVLAVHKAAGEAIARARRGEGPTLIECLTYRYRAHSEGMRETGYRTAEEIEQWKQRDPIKTFKERLLAMGAANSQELVALEQSALQTAEQAADFARKSPLPDPTTLTDYVFSEAQHA
jgi:2-oxoisovalerate dehydrogenase E1 component